MKIGTYACHEDVGVEEVELNPFLTSSLVGSELKASLPGRSVGCISTKCMSLMTRRIIFCLLFQNFNNSMN